MNSKICYGKTFLDGNEIAGSNLKNRIELEYYRTVKRKNNFLKENFETYGIEIVKKEYQGKKVNIEKQKIDEISSTKYGIDSILSILKKFKVTPIALKDVIEDIMHN